jgi:predicted negative regulator of RcsB-dependent stress response
VTFTVIATIDSLIASVNAFAAGGQIDAVSQRNLLAKLNDAKQAAERGNLASARSKLRNVIDYVSNHSGRGILTAAANLLLADARYVLDRL